MRPSRRRCAARSASATRWCGFRSVSRTSPTSSRTSTRRCANIHFSLPAPAATMKTLKTLLVCVLVPVAPAGLAADVSLTHGGMEVAPVNASIEYNLAAGLRGRFAADASKPTATLNTTYLFDSLNESYGETRMAHLLEHLMFKGTPSY